MNTDHMYRVLRTIIVILAGALVLSCREDNPEKTGPDPEPIVDPMEKEEALKVYHEGLKYFNSGNDQDYVKAHDLFLKSADAGCDSAQVVVAYMIEYGLGTTQDMENALSYYQKAADQGHENAKDKVKVLRKSTSRLDLPSEYAESVKDLLVWNDDTVRVVNGDRSFYCSGSNVIITDKLGKPLFISFRCPVGATDMTPLVMDANETAVSLLLSTLPSIFDCESEDFYRNARECIKTYPETQELAASIEASVRKNGHLEADDIKAAARSASERFFERIGWTLDKSVTNHAPRNAVARPSAPTDRSYDPYPAHSTTRASDQPSNKPEVVYVGTSERLFWMELTSDEPYYKKSKDRMEWKAKVYNYLPVYFAAIPARNQGYKMDKDSKTSPTEFIIKPFNITDIYEDIGLKGTVKWLSGIKENLGDLVNSFEAYKYYREYGVIPDDYHGRKADYQSASVSLPLNDDDDALLITSVDETLDVLGYAIVDVVAFPLIKAVLKDLKKLDEDSEAEFILAMLKFIDTKTLNNLKVCIENDDIDKMKEIIVDRTLKFLEEDFEYVRKVWDKAWVQMDPTGLMEDAVAELKVIKETLEFVELVGNIGLWAKMQFDTASFPVYFNVYSDAPPALLEPVYLGGSVYWANCNVGATTPHGLGRYYAWGETKHKDKYTLFNYLWPAYSSVYGGVGDNILGPEDDVASVLWGPKWRMPTADEISELADCDWEVKSSNFPTGYKVTSSSTRESIYFWAGGAKGEDGTYYPRGQCGEYWTSTLYNENPSNAGVLEFVVSNGFNGYQLYNKERYIGMNVRPVADIARLIVSDNSLVFDQAGSTMEHKIRIENGGMGTMEFSFMPIDGPFLIDQKYNTTYSLAPDVSMPVNIRFVPTSGSGTECFARLYIKSNSKQDPVHVIELTGRTEAGDPDVHVESVSLNKTQLELAVGGTATLTATVLPENASNKSVTWSSSRTSYATVSSTGVVTAVAPGTSVITATTVDGKKTASCTVTVRQASIQVQSVSLNKTQLDLTVGNTATLTATVLPENASNKSVTWSSSDSGKATVSSTGVVKGISAGSATITVTTVDGGKTASCKVTVAAEPKLSVSTKRLDFGEQVKFTQETKNITITNSGTGTLQISSITKTNNYGDLFQLSGWTSGGSIAAGASKTISVSFQPLEERYYEETLTIVSSNSVGDKKVVVTLCGTGIPEPEDAQIKIDVEELTWGEVEVGESVNKSFVVKNTGSTALTVSSVKVVATDNTVNPSYFTVSPNSSFSLAPGKTKTFSVAFAPEDVRSYSAMLSIKSNASNATQGTSTVWLSGSGVKATSKVLSASPSSLSFGYQTIGNRTHKNFTVKNTGTKAVTLYSMTATDGFVVDQTWEDGYSLGLAAGASKTFSAYFTPTQARAYSGKITIKSNASSGDLVIPLSGIGEEAQGYLEITSGERLDFGNVNLGASGTLYTKIRNTGEAPLSILRITCPEGFTASCTASSIKEGYNASISVSFTPTAARSYSGSVIVYTDAENESVAIDVSGTGIKSSTGNSFVDMGLSVKWASANVGASNPEEYGHYVAWAETATKKQYLYSNYKYYNADAYFSGSGFITKYCQSPDIYGYQGYHDSLRMLTYEDDYAQAKHGGLARIPTRKEWEELKKNCTWVWTSQSGTNGYLVTSSINGNSIFLPAAGMIEYSNSELNSVGYYWASNLEHDETYATTWELRSDKAWYSYRERYKGLTVRAVEDYTPKPMIEVSGSLVFAGVKVGTTASRTVTVSNTGKGTLHISEVRSTKRIGLEWTSASIEPGASKKLTVYYTPVYDPNLVIDDPETWDMTTVSITSDARNESDFVLYVKGYGIGNPGNIEGTQEEPWN